MQGIVDGLNQFRIESGLPMGGINTNEQTNEQVAEGALDRLDELEARVPVDVLDIIALNARSEIALGQWDDGCTSLAWRIRDAPSTTSSPGSGPEPGSAGYARAKQILAQNWDWRESVGKNLAMVSIAGEGKPKIWMVIEVRSYTPPPPNPRVLLPRHTDRISLGLTGPARSPGS